MNHSKETVLRFLTALNEENFTAARACVNEELTFSGVLGTRHGADAYFKDMERMKLKYVVRRVFAEEDDVCVWYDVTMEGIAVLTCGWYQLVNGKIQSFQVVFDPRPLLPPASK